MRRHADNSDLTLGVGAHQWIKVLLHIIFAMKQVRFTTNQMRGYSD
jgi:hypothetical protein